jgi:hypothetical protein
MTKPLTIFSCLLVLLFSSVKAQTRVISGKGVFIFGPSISEVDNLNLNEAEAINDFANYSNKIASFARAESINCEYISARQIKVQYSTVKVFIVDRDSVEYGTILTDGTKTPLLLKYVWTDIDLIEKCKEYFNIKEPAPNQFKKERVK